MSKKLGLILLGILAILCCHASAIDFTNWKEITVDEQLVNSSSDTIFTVMLPPGYVNTTMDAPFGAVTAFVNETDPNSTISVIVIENPIGQQLNDKNSKDYLDNFLLGANVTPLEGTEPQYLESGGIVDYGTSDNLVAGVYITSTDEKVIITTGFYSSMDNAIAGVEALAMVAGTVQMKDQK